MKHPISTKLALLAAVAMAFCVLFAGVASAQTDPYDDGDPYGGGGPDAGGEIIDNAEPSTEGAVLPFTGGEVTTFLLLGAGAIVLGTFIVRKSKNN